MIPVHQVVLNNTTGDCFRACVASLLELPIADVPNPHGDEWWGEWLAWMAERGLTLIHWDMDESTFHPPGLWIAGVEVVGCDWIHAVVARGTEVVWNPMPQPHGKLGRFLDVTLIVPLDPMGGSTPGNRLVPLLGTARP